MNRRVGWLWMVVSAAGGWCPPCGAKDYFLTIGGGYWPTGNQVSLEKNVLLYQRLLKEQYPAGVGHDIFFSDGGDPARDLQFHDPAAHILPVQRLLGQIFDPAKYEEYQYRSHGIPDVSGAASRANLQKWFDTTGPSLAAGDRLILYVTAHGGRSTDRRNPQQTCLLLWNMERLPVTEFTGWLDKLSPDVAVVVVMVQCYAGGFANLIFQEGQPAKGVTAANRCGFFATVHDRGAAGCTPDIDEEDYQEYSSYFWAAIRGRTRMDQPLARPDYDGDGAVSFAEAHAYTLLASPTVDIPVKTSEAFLRQHSKLPDAGDPLHPDGSYTELLPHASAAEAAVLKGLAEELKLADDKPAQAARDLAKRLEEEKKQLDSQRNTAVNDLKRCAEELSQAVRRQWPEFSQRWHPQLWQIVAEQGDAIRQQIEAHPRWAGFQELQQRAERLSDQHLDADRRWAKCQRWLRVLEDVSRASQLNRVASPELQQRYQRLIALESGTLGQPAPPPATAR